MKQKYIFQNDDYFNTFKEQIGSGIPVFHGVSQRGSGLGLIFATKAKYAIPLVKKYLLPHAKSAALNTISEVASGKSFKQSKKNQGLGFLKNVGKDILLNSTQIQSGKGIHLRHKNRNPVKKSTTVTKTCKKNAKKKLKLKQKPKKITKQKTKNNRKIVSKRSKLDILT